MPEVNLHNVSQRRYRSIEPQPAATCIMHKYRWS